MDIADLQPNIASKYLNQFYYESLEPNGIRFSSRRTGQSRTIHLIKSDDGDDHDGLFSRENSSSQPSSTVTTEDGEKASDSLASIGVVTPQGQGGPCDPCPKEASL
jgi:hypothetical protein